MQRLHWRNGTAKVQWVMKHCSDERLPAMTYSHTSFQWQWNTTEGPKARAGLMAVPVNCDPAWHTHFIIADNHNSDNIMTITEILL